MKSNQPFIPKTPEDGTWHFQLMVPIWIIVYILSCLILPCLCASGTAKMALITATTVGYGFRMLYAKIKKEKNDSWKTYIILICITPIIIELLTGH